MCDCKNNCADGSDEGPCPDHTCAIPFYRKRSDGHRGMFHCDDEQSIPVSLVNDKIPDCMNSLTDEEFYINISTGLRQEENTHCAKPGDIPCQDGLPRCFPTDQLCIFERHEPAGINYCRNGEHLRNCFDFECPEHFKCRFSFCVPFYLTCDGRYDCPNGEDETDCEPSCPGLLKCTLDGLCVHPRNIGDGEVQCRLSGDDEVGYQHFHCPSYCNCKGLSASCAESKLLGTTLWEWPIISLNYSKSGFRLTTGSILNVPQSLLSLDISYNNIRDVISINRLSGLLHFYMNHNSITSIGRAAFRYFTNLVLLHIVGNPIASLDPGSFVGLHKLSSLDLYQFGLRQVRPATFTGLENCLGLNLSNNQLRLLHSGMFEGLNNLLILDIRNNNLISLSRDISKQLPRVELIHLDNKKFCCLFTKETVCYGAAADNEASCDDLIPSVTARYLGWSVTLCSLILNFVSFGWWVNRNDVTVYAVAVSGLNVSDWLMACALLIVLAMDFQSRGTFVAEYSATWKGNGQCLFAAFLSVVSVLVSMSFLALIYFLRLYAIRAPFKAKDMKPYKEIATMTAFSVILSIGIGTWILSRREEDRGFTIRATHTLCNVAPTVNRQALINAGYILLLLIILIQFIVITICAWIMVYSTIIQTSSMTEGAITGSSKRLQDSRLLIRRIIMTWTCTTISFLAMTLSTVASAATDMSYLNQWLTFLVLPLNSIFNPILFTYSTPQFLLSFKHS